MHAATSKGFLPIAARLTRLALPIAAGRLGVVGMGIVDTIVVGQFAPQELAHIGLGWAIPGPALLGGIALLIGVQLLAARALGAGEPLRAGAIWWRGMVIAGVAGVAVVIVVALAAAPLLLLAGVAEDLARPAARIGLLLACSIPFHLAFVASANFLEALQRPGPAALAMWAANGVNLALNLLLVPHWGAEGSAMATILSRFSLALMLIGFIFHARALAPFRAARFAAAGSYSDLLAIGVAAFASSAAEAGAFAVLAVIAGRVGGVAVATFNIATGGLLTLVFMLALGFSSAGTVLASAEIGQGQAAQARRIGWTAIGLTLLAMAICGALSWTFAPLVARGFTADSAIVASLVIVMPLVAALMTPDGGQGVVDAMLRTRGENWFPTWARVIPYATIAPPLSLYLGETLDLGILGIFMALLLASVVAFGVLLVRYSMPYE